VTTPSPRRPAPCSTSSASHQRPGATAGGEGDDRRVPHGARQDRHPVRAGRRGGRASLNGHQPPLRPLGCPFRRPTSRPSAAPHDRSRSTTCLNVLATTPAGRQRPGPAGTRCSPWSAPGRRPSSQGELSSTSAKTSMPPAGAARPQAVLVGFGGRVGSCSTGASRLIWACSLLATISPWRPRRRRRGGPSTGPRRRRAAPWRSRRG
jgi:hypothetical protein